MGQVDRGLDLPGGLHLQIEDVQGDGQHCGDHQPEDSPAPHGGQTPQSLPAGRGRAGVAPQQGGVRHSKDEDRNQQEELLAQHDLTGELRGYPAFVGNVPVESEETVHLGGDDADVERERIVDSEEMNNTTEIVIGLKKGIKAIERIVDDEKSRRGQDVEFKYVYRLQGVAMCPVDTSHHHQVEQAQRKADEDVPVFLCENVSVVVAASLVESCVPHAYLDRSGGEMESKISEAPGYWTGIE